MQRSRGAWLAGLSHDQGTPILCPFDDGICREWALIDHGNLLSGKIEAVIWDCEHGPSSTQCSRSRSGYCRDREGHEKDHAFEKGGQSLVRQTWLYHQEREVDQTVRRVARSMTRASAFVLGYHGCDRAVGEKVLANKEHLRASDNDYDWLGTGIYFWETAFGGLSIGQNSRRLIQRLRAQKLPIRS